MKAEKTFDKDLQELIKREQLLGNKLVDLDKERQSIEKKIQSIKMEETQLQTQLQHRKEVTEERDKQIIAFAKRYKIAGYENIPFSPQEAKQLLSIARDKLQQSKERIAQIKDEFMKEDDELAKALEKLKEEQNSCKERILQANKILNTNQQKLIAIATDIKNKQTKHSNLTSYQQRILKQEEIIATLKTNINSNQINKEIESMKLQKVETDKKLVETTDLMKHLNIQVSQRASLNLKKEQLAKVQQEYNKM